MRLSAKAPIVIRGEEITHLDADGYKHLPRATSLPDGKVLATSGGKWGASDLSGVSVASVFGRTGAVAAQTGDYTAAQVGAEPYAGAPAQTSFWRSTAAGVRAWVQLVAADITDLATTLAGYLTKANPTFTGLLTGPSATLSEFGVLRDYVGHPAFGALYAAGVTPATTNYVLAMTDAGTETYLGASDKVVLVVGGTSKLTVDADEANLASGVALKMAEATVIDASRNITGTTVKGLNAAGTGTRPAVALADGTFDDQDAATFRGTIGAGTSNLALGETSATAYRGDLGKIAYDHSQATGNPHGTTAADVGALATADPVFTGALKQSGTTRITSGGGADFASLRVSNLASAFSGVLTSDYVGGVGVRGAADFRDNYIQAAASDHNHFSKLDVSASTTLGAIDATAIKVTATDVNLTLSGGVNGQGWDIVCPTTSFGISIPTGVTLYAYAGSDIGPTTRAVGGGRGIRIVRIDAATWIAPNLTW